tara:strand:+ start:1578 stop:1679 length:102 start_codon:yes stop_codon:yes gene_type:complete
MLIYRFISLNITEFIVGKKLVIPPKREFQENPL